MRTQYEIQKELQRTDWEGAYMGIMGYDNSISYSDITEEDIDRNAENLRSQHEDVDESQVGKAKRYLRLMQEWEAAAE